MIFIQDWGTYSNETLVAVGETRENIFKWMKKNGIRQELIDQLEEDLEDNETMHRDCDGLVSSKDGRTFLWLKQYRKNNHDDADCLMHECLHLIQFVLFDEKGMADEKEGPAYQLEYLVRNIRNKILSKKK